MNDCAADQLADSISCLTAEVRHFSEQCKKEWEWNRSHSKLATKEDLTEMEGRMALKLSELKNEVAGLRAQVTKIWGEQQTKYDNLVVEFDKLKASLDNVELPADVEQDLAEFKAQLQGFDDSIPDTTV